MKYGFIGCGNMGGALARALSKTTKDIMLCDPYAAESLAGELGCIAGENEQAAANCQCIFLAVKPQILEKVLIPIAETLKTCRPLLITMAAGVSINKIQSIIGSALPVIRIMPNTPAMIGCGTILYCANELVSTAAVATVIDDMRYAGMFDAIDEKLIDAASALSGCGPAYVYMFIEALADGAVACGVPRDKALAYAANTLVGAAQMVLQTGTHPGALKDAVCSPGGSTIAGVRALERHGFRGAVMDCIQSAYVRTKELGN